MVTYMVLFLTPMSLVPALFVWSWPSWGMLVWLVLMGGVATLGHLALTRAFTLADASAMMPFDYTKLPFAALLGYLAFGETMDLWSWVGAGIIAGAPIYIAQREARLARRIRSAVGTAEASAAVRNPAE